MATTGRRTCAGDCQGRKKHGHYDYQRNQSLFHGDSITHLAGLGVGHRPSEAAMAIYYRDSWFYINDSDLQSKSTFSLLAQIFSLQSGNAKDKAPLLTLPLGN